MLFCITTRTNFGCLVLLGGKGSLLDIVYMEHIVDIYLHSYFSSRMLKVAGLAVLLQYNDDNRAVEESRAMACYKRTAI
ncbi:hypothetical protein V6N12_020402 [Hibiscus sabdariffa]|uniref:Uncharacterized protein n=1 Tax=Hibiscus sabdariffa TaxID=183260 RepID=A0ABR2CYT2_9ROSI